ncbi:carbohydrate sulfotransferase 12-like [Oratosquilla oratoria]|uniref:carbohydrate sulfotransferase 12-like n=1 Tax=Oratosquilla oratoria TaxID=337810 RepID=UPI003F773B96
MQYRGDKLECLQRTSTSKIGCVKGMNYWDRLKHLKLFTPKGQRTVPDNLHVKNAGGPRPQHWSDTQTREDPAMLMEWPAAKVGSFKIRLDAYLEIEDTPPTPSYSNTWPHYKLVHRIPLHWKQHGQGGSSGSFFSSATSTTSTPTTPPHRTSVRKQGLWDIWRRRHTSNTGRSRILREGTVARQHLMGFLKIPGRHWSYVPLIFVFFYFYFIGLSLDNSCTGGMVGNRLQNNEEHKQEEESKRRSDEQRAKLKRTCALLNISEPVGRNHLNHILVDDKHKVLYCYIPKVACTSWKRVLMKMTGLVEPTTNLSSISREVTHTSLPSLLDPKYKNSATDILKSYKKFMFTKQPFTRVLSAFKDKIEADTRRIDHVVKKIQKTYQLETDEHDVTFSEFIRFISEPGDGSVEERNEHWLPMHELCNPCTIEYDFIGKFENMKEDSDYVLRWLGVKDLIGDFPFSDRATNARQIKDGYFDQISYKEKMAFFSKYLVDFILFNYDFM